MNLELFISKRIGSKKSGVGNISAPIVRIAIIGIVLGFVVMLLSVAIVRGYKKEVSSKMVGFAADVQVTNFDNNLSYETTGIQLSDSLRQSYNEIPGVKLAQFFSTKPGILKIDNKIHGVVMHGTSKKFDRSFISKHLEEGKFYKYLPNKKSNECVISKNISKMLNVGVGDKVDFWFIQQPPRARRFKVVGIYSTGLKELDDIIVYCDIRHIQKLNSWRKDEYSGMELFLEDGVDRDFVYEKIRQHSVLNSRKGRMLRAVRVEDRFSFIFDWLAMLDINIWIILVLMCLVAGFNMVSSLIILIIEKTNMIGILKSLGQSSVNVRKIFIYLSAKLVGKGLLWGNLIGITLCMVQKYFKLISLNPDSYYLDAVPISLNILDVLLLNIGTMFITILMLVIPSMIISKISPIKSINFD